MQHSQESLLSYYSNVGLHHSSTHAILKYKSTLLILAKQIYLCSQ